MMNSYVCNNITLLFLFNTAAFLIPKEKYFPKLVGQVYVWKTVISHYFEV